MYLRTDAAPVWARGAGRDHIARAVPADDGSLHFHFERGDSTYRELVSTFLRAIVTVDRASKRILGVSFRGWRAV
jgi:hypothetical protein